MACVRHAHLPPHRAARLIAEARQLHARKALPPFPLRPLPHPQRREISAAHPAPGWEVWLYAVLAAKFALRDEQASTVDEAVFAQRVDAALTGLEGSLNMALGLRRRANKEVAARELDDVVQVRGSLRNGHPSRAVGGCALDRPTPCPAMPQVMRRPKDLLSRQGQDAAFVCAAWPLEHVAFSPSQLFDFLHRQLQPQNPYCRSGRYRWRACRAAIGAVLKSGAFLSITEQLDAQQHWDLWSRLGSVERVQIGLCDECAVFLGTRI